MKIARTLGLFTIAVLFTGVPMFAGCYSDCDEAYESCTAGANYAAVQCEEQCYYDDWLNIPPQCQAGFEQCMDITYPNAPNPPACSYYTAHQVPYEQWPFVCQLCHFDYMVVCHIGAFQNCEYGCDDALYGALSQCDSSNYQCKGACCGDATCEGDESCETCSADCGPC